MPAIYVSKEYINAGRLIAYGPSYPDLYRRAAIYVDKILRGASPSSLPVEQPTKFELTINLKAAGAIGLQVPLTLMVRADEVIEWEARGRVQNETSPMQFSASGRRRVGSKAGATPRCL
jgi:putative tryptophan/tyrosine transport system substrate-binding protein